MHTAARSRPPAGSSALRRVRTLRTVGKKKNDATTVAHTQFVVHVNTSTRPSPQQ